LNTDKDKDKTATVASDYVTYLTNEMTIMGILSTFCTIAIGGFVTVLSGISKDSGPWLKELWNEQGAFILLALSALLLSAFFFYRQRSILSYYVGQIHLSRYDEKLADGSVHALHERANGWITWRFYRIAFLWLFTAAALFGRAAFALVPDKVGCFWSLYNRMRTWELWAPPALCILLCVLVCVAFAAFPDKDHPYRESVRHPVHFLKGIKFLLSGGLE
jgi:hypothetical protein